MQDLASPGVLRNLKEANFKGPKDLLGDAAADSTVKPEKVDNTTATISMRGPLSNLQSRSSRTMAFIGTNLKLGDVLSNAPFLQSTRLPLL
jgi:hypothetical protein